MSTIDWRAVYREERQRPGYVLENGKSPIKLDDKGMRKPPKESPQQKRKVA